MKVLTFSRVYPSYHPRKGESTFFVDKIISGEKSHTIRAGNRWKVGDKFSPRVWSDKPYRSPQIEFAPAIEVKKVFDFKVTDDGYLLNGKSLNLDGLTELAKNDGLGADDFELWFAPYTKKGGL